MLYNRTMAGDCQTSIRKDLYERGAFRCERSEQVAVDLLTANTAQMVTLPPTVSPKEFMTFYTGSKLRWEALGIFLTSCGLCIAGLSAKDIELEFNGRSEQDKQRLMFRLLEASDICVSLCDDAGYGTDWGFWLMIENCMYASQVLGDAHYLVWRKLGDLSTAVFARSYHAIGQKSGPFWLDEMRRRALGYTYAMEKMLSAFVGRPPRISKRYCNIGIPLDIGSYQVLSAGNDINLALAAVDEDGWNTGVKRRTLKECRHTPARSYLRV